MRPVRALLTVLVSIVLLLSGLGGVATAGPAHHQPSVGSCYDYGMASSAVRASRVPSSCSSPHIALTVAVLRFDGTRDTASIERAVVGCGRALVGLLAARPA